MKFDLYRPEEKGSAGKCFPVHMNVHSEKTFIEAVEHDNIGVEFKDGLRKHDCFLSSNVIIMDCDNKHSDNSLDWIQPLEFGRIFWHINYAYIYSKSYWRDNSDNPRPRFHVYFPITSSVDERGYTAFKKMLQKIYPFFDEHALSPTTYFWGIRNTDTVWHEGGKNIDEVFLPLISHEGEPVTDEFGFLAREEAGGRNGV